MDWRCGSMVVVLGLSGCSRQNPAFGDDDPAAGTTGTPNGSTGDTTEGPPDPTLDGPIDGTTSASATGFETTGGHGTSTSGEPLDTDADPSTGEPVCVPEFGEPLGFEANPPFPLAGCAQVVTHPLGYVDVISPSSIIATVCNGCPCEALTEPVELTFSVPLPPLPDCLLLHVQYGIDTSGSCVVQAYSMQAFDAVFHVVSNIVDPALPEPFDFVLDDGSWEPCGDDCQGQAGYYGLLSNGTMVESNGMATAVPGVNGSQYEVVDIVSGIGADCIPVARWYARPPG